jgi:hypothetical protein
VDPVRLRCVGWRDGLSGSGIGDRRDLWSEQMVEVSLKISSNDVDRINELMAYAESLYQLTPTDHLEKELAKLSRWFEALVLRFNVEDVLQNG